MTCRAVIGFTTAFGARACVEPVRNVAERPAIGLTGRKLATWDWLIAVVAYVTPA